MSLPVIHVVDNLHVGGAQQLLATWAREAARRGDPVTVISLDAEEGRIGATLRSLGADVVTVPPSGAGSLGAVGDLRRLGRLVRERRPAVVQTHLTRAHFLGLTAARLSGMPAVATLHSARVGDDGNSPRALAGERLVLRRLADVVVACGAVVEREQRSRLQPTQAVVVPNATDPVKDLSPAERAEVRRALGAEAAIVLLAVGRLDRSKGYDELLAAFDRVAALFPQALLVIAGSGPHEDRMRKHLTGAASAARVRLLGQRSDVAALMSAADVYVSASYAEGLPVAMLEAMSAGLPVVATAVGDVPSVVDEASGILVPPADAASFADALVMLLSDQVALRAAGVAARQRVAQVAGVPDWYDKMRAVHGAAAARRQLCGSQPDGPSRPDPSTARS